MLFNFLLKQNENVVLITRIKIIIIIIIKQTSACHDTNYKYKLTTGNLVQAIKKREKNKERAFVNFMFLFIEQFRFYLLF